MENLPLITVIAPCYNASDYVTYALDSLIHQTYTNLEILVINDGSKDEGKTKEAIRPFLSDSRVCYLEKENGGVSSVLNLGISLAKGDFIVWLSHDDVFTPDSLMKRYQKWVRCGSDPKIIVSTGTQYINAEGKKIFRLASPSKNVKNIYDMLSSTINGCSLLIPRSALGSHRFKEGMIFMQDYFLWAELIGEGVRICYLPEKLTMNRIHKGQVTQQKFDQLVRDFADFDATFIAPLMAKQDYHQIKQIAFTMESHLSVRPFYQQYIKKYVSFLKEHKKWGFSDILRLRMRAFVAYIVKCARK